MKLEDMKLEEIVKDIKSKTDNAVVSLSGGLDSTILTYLLVEALGKENVACISFDYNQRHDIELRKAKTTTKHLGVKHKIIDIGFLGDVVKDVSAMVKGDVATPNVEDILGDPQPVTYVPNRNMILSSITASYCEAVGFNTVAMGIQAIDSYSYWDTTPDFANAINDIFALNRKSNMQIITPFVNMTKVDEINLGLEMGVIFEDTHTCYNPDGELSCGVCPSCAERLASFEAVGLTDPLNYK
jgi:7-cyano-7-deazaguanine synthase